MLPPCVAVPDNISMLSAPSGSAASVSNLLQFATQPASGRAYSQSLAVFSTHLLVPSNSTVPAGARSVRAIGCNGLLDGVRTSTTLPLHEQKVQPIRLGNAECCQNRVRLPTMMRLVIEQMRKDDSTALFLRTSV